MLTKLRGIDAASLIELINSNLMSDTLSDRWERQGVKNWVIKCED